MKTDLFALALNIKTDLTTKSVLIEGGIIPPDRDVSKVHLISGAGCIDGGCTEDYLVREYPISTTYKLGNRFFGIRLLYSCFWVDKEDPELKGVIAITVKSPHKSNLFLTISSPNYAFIDNIPSNIESFKFKYKCSPYKLYSAYPPYCEYGPSVDREMGKAQNPLSRDISVVLQFFEVDNVVFEGDDTIYTMMECDGIAYEPKNGELLDLCRMKKDRSYLNRICDPSLKDQELLSNYAPTYIHDKDSKVFYRCLDDLETKKLNSKEEKDAE